MAPLWWFFTETLASASRPAFAEAMEVAVRRHGEDARRGQAVVLVGMPALPTQAAHRAVFQLLHARHQRHIVHAGCHGHGRIAKCIRAGGAVVLHARDGLAVEPQRVGQRHGGLAVPRIGRERAQPRGFHALRLDARVGECRESGLHQQIFETLVEVIAELGAAYADDGDLVFNRPAPWLMSRPIPAGISNSNNDRRRPRACGAAPVRLPSRSLPPPGPRRSSGTESGHRLPDPPPP